MRGNSQARFLGGLRLATAPGYPTEGCSKEHHEINKESKMITRRYFLKWVAFSVAAVGFWPRLSIAGTSSGDNRPRKFQWRVPEAHYETVKKELRFEGEIREGERDAKGIPLVFFFVGAVLLPYLAKAVLALRRDIVYGGVIIDTRGETIEIDTDKSLPNRVIVIVTPKGTDLYERDEIDNPAELVDVLLKAK